MRAEDILCASIACCSHEMKSKRKRVCMAVGLPRVIERGDIRCCLIEPTCSETGGSFPSPMAVTSWHAPRHWPRPTPYAPLLFCLFSFASPLSYLRYSLEPWRRERRPRKKHRPVKLLIWCCTIFVLLTFHLAIH